MDNDHLSSELSYGSGENSSPNTRSNNVEIADVFSERSTWLDRLRRTGRKIKYSGQIAMVGAVVLPINEGVRLPPAIAVQAYTNNSIAGGVALGVTSLAVELAGTWSTSSLIDTNNGEKVFKWLNEKKEKVLHGRTMTPSVEATVAYFGGTAVVLAAKQAEDPTRTIEQNRRHGALTSGWLSMLVGAQWAAGGNLIQNPTLTNVVTALALTAGAYGGAKLGQRIEERQKD